MNSPISTPPGYRALDADHLSAYLASLPGMAHHLGRDVSAWKIEEVGDGNLNLVFKVRGPEGGLIVKQALPYVRLVGDSWPLPLSRAHYEHMALSVQARHTGKLVPEIHHYDEAMALIVMELLEPHIIMRRGMIAGTVYPKFAEDISTFLARTLFFTSDLALKAAAKKRMIADFAGNTALCKITEDLIFSDPYRVAPLNRWTAPQLDSYAARFREDGDLHVAVSRLKLKFLSSAEAMIHGDLHTGSVMVTEAETRIIDPEFAFMGPMGFDIGAVIANLLISFFSQAGHEDANGARDAYRNWILGCVQDVWSKFQEKFTALWASDAAQGDAFQADLFQGELGAARLAGERNAYMQRLWNDTLGFAAAKMIRRVLGLAHNIDLEWIKDPQIRSACEARVLTLARDMMVNAGNYPSPSGLVSAANTLNAWRPPLGE